MLLTTTKLLKEMLVGTESALETSRQHSNHPNYWFFSGSLVAINDLLHQVIVAETVEEFVEMLYTKLFEYQTVGYGDWQSGRLAVVKHIKSKFEGVT